MHPAHVHSCAMAMGYCREGTNGARYVLGIVIIACPQHRQYSDNYVVSSTVYFTIVLTREHSGIHITGAYPGFSEGGGPRSAKQANQPNKRATELKPRTCAHQGSMFRPY